MSAAIAADANGGHGVLEKGVEHARRTRYTDVLSGVFRDTPVTPVYAIAYGRYIDLVAQFLFLVLRLKGPTPYVLTPAKLAEVKAVCDAEDAKPEHEKRFNGYNNPCGLKQPSWRR